MIYIVIWGPGRYLFLFSLSLGGCELGHGRDKLGDGEVNICKRFFCEGGVCRKRYREQRNRHGLCHGSYLLLIIGARTE